MREMMIDELVDHDMSCLEGRWVGYEREMFEEGIDIEGEIVSSLVDDLVSDLLSKVKVSVTTKEDDQQESSANVYLLFGHVTHKVARDFGIVKSFPTSSPFPPHHESESKACRVKMKTMRSPY
ncbi:hypothetical protein YC2023_091260 [Brassica napus]